MKVLVILMLTALSKSLWIYSEGETAAKGSEKDIICKFSYVWWPFKLYLLDESNFLFIIWKFIKSQSQTVFLVKACPTVSGVADT